MRINGSTLNPVHLQSQNVDALRQQHQVRVLKKALESQKAAGEQLLQMLDPKGQTLDIKA